MDFPVQKGDKGADVIAVQQCLNRLGMLLVCDGAFGGGTATAIQAACTQLGLPPQSSVDEALWEKLSEIPEPCPDLPTDGVTFIAQAEVSSRNAYEQSYSHPTWPSDQSGMTIGVGYDLQFSTQEQFNDDWGSLLPADDMEQLSQWLGKVGSKQGVQDLKGTHQSFAAAWEVFCAKTIPGYVAKTARTFPGYDSLPPLCKSALVSLVYNRGTKLTGDSRREMQAIHDLIVAGQLEQVPDQFRAMKRLWPTLPGLQKRRDGEADLWEDGLKAAS